MNLLEVTLTNAPLWTLSINVAWPALALGVLILLLALLGRVASVRKSFGVAELVEFEVGHGPGKAKFVVDKVEANIYTAHRILVELETRKAALDIDPERDVIIEVYDSWYELFRTVREEIKNIPARYLKREDTRQLLAITTSLLNGHLRPHLTEFQARFRHWFEQARVAEENTSLTPQEIQAKYPDFGKLIEDMRGVNQRIREHVNQLKKIVS